MIAPSHASIAPVVLAVDDEAVSLTLLAYYLKKAGYRSVAVNSAKAAREYIAQEGPEAVQCVITDYRMPEETGLELLLWLKQQDPSLSVIMITATTEREFVAETLRGGASGFLDKPITESNLRQAVASGIDVTTRLRQSAETQRAVTQVARTQHQLFGLGPTAATHLQVCFHPRHQVGGDFVSYFQITPDHFLVLSADVSGHDLHAAFVSAYFQGMMRGMLEAGQSVTTLLAKFNTFLIEEWGEGDHGEHGSTQASLSVCAATIDLRRGELTLHNHGAPQPWRVGRDGLVTACTTDPSHPLGWFDELAAEPAHQRCPEGGELILWTDGLEDLATELQVSPFSLAAGLRYAHERGKAPEELNRATDDVLVVFVRLEAGAPPRWTPILGERYSGDQPAVIDRLQGYWERCLQVAVPDLSESRRFDVLLALREAVLNAMVHGCAGRTDQYCTLTICVAPTDRMLRAMIGDPGPGHTFKRATESEDDDIADLHRGLALISRLSTHVQTARQGAELTLDFRY